MIAAMLTMELLMPTMQSQRALQLAAAIRAQAAHAQVRVVPTPAYVGQSDVLLLWGPGGLDRMPPMQAQLATGRHVAAFDLAYWHRDRKVRVSFNHAHPQAWVMRQAYAATRFSADRVAVSDQWDPNGPVIVAGIGRKARVQYGDAVDVWERGLIAEARTTWPTCRVLYRRKQSDAPTPPGVPALDCTRPIEQVLAGARLVVTWHSNVAVDAIRMGIPVVCRDGAAAAVCPSVIRDPRPLVPAVRDAFLANLAWFQWAPSEAGLMLAWIREALA